MQDLKKQPRRFWGFHKEVVVKTVPLSQSLVSVSLILDSVIVVVSIFVVPVVLSSVTVVSVDVDSSVSTPD